MWRSALPLSLALLSLASGCKNFPVVETRGVNIFPNAKQEQGIELKCVRRLDTGELVEADPFVCRQYFNCAISDQDGTVKILPLDACDETIGYSPFDHERILKWGRQNCAKK